MSDDSSTSFSSRGTKRSSELNAKDLRSRKRPAISGKARVGNARDVTRFCTYTPPLKLQYTLSFPQGVRKSRRAKENEAFAKRLHDEAVPPTSSEVNRLHLAGSRSVPKLDAYGQLLEHLKHPTAFDVDDLNSEDAVNAALQADFQVIRIKSEHSVTSSRGWSLEKQILSVPKASSGFAVQPYREPTANGGTTHRIDDTAIRRIFIDQQIEQEELATNCLDIANRSHARFCPDSVVRQDLVVRIKEHPDFPQQKGKGERGADSGLWGRGFDDVVDDEARWCICSLPNSVSPFHVDHMGQCTVIVVIGGTKVWHIPIGQWEVVRKEFELYGSLGTNYGGGVAEYELREGDCLIQGPGTVHAVSTPGSATCIAGNFFYTAPTFGRSIKCIRLQYEQRIYENDDAKAPEYRRLAFIIRNMELPGILTSLQATAVFVETASFLRYLGLIKKDEPLGDYMLPDELRATINQNNYPAKLAKVEDLSERLMTEDSKTDVGKAELEFVWAMLSWWWKRFSRQPAW